jgi:PKD domain
VRRRTTFHLFGLVVACIGFGLLATPAVTAPAWLAATDISTVGGDTSAPRIAIDEQGDAFAVWYRTYDGGSTFVVEVASRPAATGVWQAPVQIPGSGQAAWPDIAVDAQGDAMVTWYIWDVAQNHWKVQATMRPATTGVWESPVDLSATGQSADSPQVTFDSRGNAIAIWRRGSGSDWSVQTAMRPSGTNSWQAPVDLSLAGPGVGAFSFAFDSDDNALAVWTRFDGAHWIVQAAYRSHSSGVWQLPVDISAAGQDASGPLVGFDSHGNAFASWARFDGTHTVAQVAFRPAASGIWQAPSDLSSTVSDASAPGIAFDRSGNAIALWAASAGGTSTVQTALRAAATGTWQPAVALSPPGVRAEGLRMASDSHGDVVAVWLESTGIPGAVRAALRPADTGTWQTPVNLTGADQEVWGDNVAFDGQGNILAVWGVSDSSRRTVLRAAGYDFAGPSLDSLVIPPHGESGRSLTFSVTPNDRWSGLGVTTWHFGDGTSALGVLTKHRYSKAGVYHVTVTSSDAIGNDTTATGTISIAATHRPSPPRFLVARLSRARFRAATRPNEVVSRLRVSLSSPARLAITVTAPRPGLRRDGRCVAATPYLRDRHAKRCSRVITLGTIPHSAAPEQGSLIALTGRLRGFPLTPGHYTLLLRAVNTDAHPTLRAIHFIVLP